jgi:hypothetical protein
MFPKLKFSFGASFRSKFMFFFWIFIIIFVTFVHSEKLAVLAETVHFNGLMIRRMLLPAACWFFPLALSSAGGRSETLLTLKIAVLSKSLESVSIPAAAALGWWSRLHPSTAQGHVRAFRQNLAVRAYSVAQGLLRLKARQKDLHLFRILISKIKFLVDDFFTKTTTKS